MFTQTHDIILLILAALYVLTALIRAGQVNAYVRATGKAPRGTQANLTAPMLLATLLVIVAVLW